MIPSLPPEIKALMTVPIVWEQFDGFDGHAEPSYEPPYTLYCFQEAHGSGSGGLDVVRHADGTTVVPTWDFYFDGDNYDAEQFTVYDRFTPEGAGNDDESLQAIRINTFVGPNFDNKNPWLIVVTVG